MNVRFAQSLGLICLLAVTVSFAQDRAGVWIGIGFTAENLDFPPARTQAHSALRLIEVALNSPAEKGGLLVGDLIIGVDGHDFQAVPGVLEGQLRESIVQRKPGDGITLRILRDGRVTDIHLAVEPRPGEAPIKDFSLPKITWPEEQLGSTLIKEFKIQDAYKDLRQRLA